MTCFSWSTNLAVKGIQISWTNGSSSSKIKWLRSWNTKTFLKTKFKGLNTIFRLALHISLKHEKPQWESTLQWYYTYSWPWWDCKAWQDMAMVSNVSNLILGFLEERRCLLLSMICNTEGEKIKYTVLHATKANVFLAPPPFFFTSEIQLFHIKMNTNEEFLKLDPIFNWSIMSKRLLFNFYSLCTSSKMSTLREVWWTEILGLTALTQIITRHVCETLFPFSVAKFNCCKFDLTFMTLTYHPNDEVSTFILSVQKLWPRLKLQQTKSLTDRKAMFPNLRFQRQKN